MSVTRKKLPIPSFQHCTTFLFYLVRINSHRNVKMVYFSFSFFTQGKWSYLYLRLIYERKKRKRYLSNMFLLPPFFLYFFHNLQFFYLEEWKRNIYETSMWCSVLCLFRKNKMKSRSAKNVPQIFDDKTFCLSSLKDN